MDPRAAAFARLFEVVHEGVFIGVLAATPDGGDSTLAANPHLRRMFGYADAAAEHDLHPFAAARFADLAARTTFLARLQSDGAVTDFPLRMRRLDGSAIWVEVTARTETATNAGMRIEALVRDVSERKKLDDQSRDLYQQLLQAEKMAALGQTISGVAHELNNPLATILTWAERLAEQAPPPTKRGVDIILGEAERAARIVRSLLIFAHKRQTTRSMSDLNEIVRETLALRADEQQRAGIDTTVALTAGLPHVFVDGYQIRQVLLNLLLNAEQAMLGANGRGRLAVHTRHDVERDAIVLHLDDDGPGIPEEVRHRIFDPFFTTKEVGTGTGLGLAVAYAIVQEHGGRIRVQADGTLGGASFVVELPVSGVESAPAAKRVPALSMEAVRGARLLLVEDERALATAVVEALTDAGLAVDHAGDGEEALGCVRRAQYDAIVCDLKMPRVDGMMLYRAIAAATPALARRVIFMTGDVAGTDAERFLADSGCRWLAKPFRLADLLRAVRDTLT